uniref:Major capsid protein n=1 Tax=Dulem virus 240 TaxID=3145717 RepID=A0AAU8B5C4_9VIRU
MNPSTSNARSAKRSPLVSTDSLNNPQAFNKESYNTFDLSRRRLTTQRFDQILPVFMDAEIEGNKVSLQSRHDLRTYTLASPLLNNVAMDRSFFSVPWSAIAPNTWEYLYRTPVKGEDIEYPDVLQTLILSDFYSILDRDRAQIVSFVTTGTFTTSVLSQVGLVQRFVNYILLMNQIFSQAGLAKCLGFTFPSELPKWADTMYDTFIRAIAGQTLSGINIQDELESIVYSDRDGIFHQLNLHPVDPIQGSISPSLSEVFNFFDEYIEFAGNTQILFNWKPSFSADNVKTWMNYIVSSFMVPTVHPTTSIAFSDTKMPFCLEPLISYQMIVAQYYSNDHVDDIYTARMFLQDCLSANQGTIMKWRTDTSAIQDFLYQTVNGVSFPVDAFARKMFSEVLNLCMPDSGVATDFVSGKQDYFYAILFKLFAIHKSLRYGDYFTCARTQPLAVGDVRVSVNSDNTVSAVAINERLWIQRFLNAVNRAPQDIYDYLYQIAGVDPKNKTPEPHFIASERFNLNGMEVENTTSDNQGNVVTLLRNSESRYMFEVFLDEPSYIIGVDTFVLGYCYPESTRKLFYRDERFDWFNHFVQHIGDQTVNISELMNVPPDKTSEDNIFGYQLRYAQFKNAISEAVGGFLDGSLPSWAVLFKPQKRLNPTTYEEENIQQLNPWFLRNNNGDFDALYSSLTGANYCSRFHFIKSIDFKNFNNSKMQDYPTLV